MARKPRARADRHKSLDSLLILGVGLVFATIPVAISIVFFLEQSLHPDYWELVETGVLIAAATVLALLWLKVPMDERLLLLDLGEERFPTTPGFALPLVIVSDAAFLALMVLAIWPAAFALMLLLIKLVESWNAYLFKRYLDERLQLVWPATELPESQKARGIDLKEWKRQAGVLYQYYFERPWYGLALTEAVALAFASSIAVYAARDLDLNLRHLLGAIATGLLLVALVGNEIVASIWRAWRDREVDRDLEDAGPDMPRMSRRDYVAELALSEAGEPTAAESSNSSTTRPKPRAGHRKAVGSRPVSIPAGTAPGEGIRHVGRAAQRDAGEVNEGQARRKPRTR